MLLALRSVCAFAILVIGPTLFTGLDDRLGLMPVAQAQESVKVWVNSRSGVYHCPGTRYYGNTRSGQYMAEADAREGGNRPAYGQSCGGVAAGAPEVTAQRLTADRATNEAVAGSTVWVNTRSGVYHCPGTRYYGNTRTGEYMSEPEARAAGNRPAYGRPCG